MVSGSTHAQSLSKQRTVWNRARVSKCVPRVMTAASHKANSLESLTSLLLHQPMQASLPSNFHYLLTNTFISHSLILICLQPLILARVRPSTAPSVKSSEEEAAAVTRLALTHSGSQGSHKGTEREVADKVGTTHAQTRGLCRRNKELPEKPQNNNKKIKAT